MKMVAIRASMFVILYLNSNKLYISNRFITIL